MLQKPNNLIAERGDCCTSDAWKDSKRPLNSHVSPDYSNINRATVTFLLLSVSLLSEVVAL